MNFVDYMLFVSILGTVLCIVAVLIWAIYKVFRYFDENMDSFKLFKRKPEEIEMYVNKDINYSNIFDTLEKFYEKEEIRRQRYGITRKFRVYATYKGVKVSYTSE